MSDTNEPKVINYYQTGDQILNFNYDKGKKEIYPAHRLACHCQFNEGEEAEAALLHHMAVVAEKNGMTMNDLLHLFPAVLRMFKSKIAWAK